MIKFSIVHAENIFQGSLRRRAGAICVQTELSYCQSGVCLSLLMLSSFAGCAQSWQVHHLYKRVEGVQGSSRASQFKHAYTCAQQQKLGPTAHAGKNTQLNHSSLDRLTGQKYISPPPGLQCRHLSSRCLPRVTSMMVSAIIRSSNKMYLDSDAL